MSKPMNRLAGLALAAAVPLALAACDGVNLDAVQFGTGGFAEAGEVTGFWTGEATLAQAFASPGEGDRYRVALTLDPGGWFTLRSDYPPVYVDPGPVRRCDGVWTLRGGQIEFYPDDYCPALALTTLNVRLRTGTMVLEAFRTQPISTSLHMQLWRS